jgi:ammonium transporter Rh
MITVAVFELFFYMLNFEIGYIQLKTVDIGGSMYIHAFGAIFGLACSYFASPKNCHNNKNNAASYTSNVIAMVGTIFLWLFWPSFNGAFGNGN